MNEKAIELLSGLGTFTPFYTVDKKGIHKYTLKEYDTILKDSGKLYLVAKQNSTVWLQMVRIRDIYLCKINAALFFWSEYVSKRKRFT